MAMMEELKLERTAKKRLVTTKSSRVKKAVQEGYSSAAIEAAFADLEIAALDFFSINQEYIAALEEDETLKEEYETVSGMNTEEYTRAVDKCFNETKQLYEDHQEQVSEASQTKKSVVQRKQVHTFMTITSAKVQVISRREAQENRSLVELRISRKDLKDLANEVKEMMIQMDVEEEDYSTEKAELLNILNEIEENKYTVTVKLESLSENVGVDEGDATPSVSKSEQPSTTSTSTPSTTIPPPPPLTSTNAYPSGLLNAFPGIMSTSTGLQGVAGAHQSSSSTAATTGFTTGSNPLASGGSSWVTTQPPSSYGRMSWFGMTPTSSQAPVWSHTFNPFIPSSTGFFTSSASQPHTPLVPPNTPISPFPPFPENPAPEVKVKRAELPVFTGRHSEWPQFKVMWPKLAIPAFKRDQETLAQELKTRGVTGDAAKKIQSCPMVGEDAFTNMWGRLCKHYDDPAMSVNDALQRIDDLKPVREEDYSGLTYFIDQVEISYTQLTTLDQLGCLTLRDVDKLCNKLPLTKKTEWQRVYYDLNSDTQLHPFPRFMQFLDRERGIVSRLVSTQEPAAKKKEVRSHYTSDNQQGGNKNSNAQQRPKFPNCVLHGDAKHTTEMCNDFKNLNPVEAKYDALRSVNACFRCFADHRRNRCRKRDPCENCGDSRHHTLMCRRGGEAAGSDRVQSPPISESSETNAVVPTTSGYTADKKARGVFAIYSVPVANSNKKAVVFADDGSDSSYIRNDAARRLGARKVKKFVLEVTTTGGREIETESQQYELDILTRSGRTVTISLFGLDKITGSLSKLDLDALSKLFHGYDVSQLQRQATEVDILLGTEYFGLHPKIEIRRAGENLSIMRGPLGICLQGSHPSLKVDNSMHSNSVKVLRAANFIQGQTYLCAVTVKDPLIDQPRTVKPCESASLQSKHDPSALPDNRGAVPATLRRLETKLRRQPSLGVKYQEQIQDMDRKVVREMSGEAEDLTSGAEEILKNEHPVGGSSSDAELSVSTPNSLLFGRSTAKNPGGWEPGGWKQLPVVQQVSTAFRKLNMLVTSSYSILAPLISSFTDLYSA